MAKEEARLREAMAQETGKQLTKRKSKLEGGLMDKVRVMV